MFKYVKSPASKVSTNTILSNVNKGDTSTHFEVSGQKLSFPCPQVNTANSFWISSPWPKSYRRSFFSDLKLHLCVDRGQKHIEKAMLWKKFPCICEQVEGLSDQLTAQHVSRAQLWPMWVKCYEWCYINICLTYQNRTRAESYLDLCV